MTRLRTTAFIAAALVMCGCAQRFLGREDTVMPDPGGCYVLVYAEPHFVGPREFVNGPEKYYTLRNLPFGANWRKRIRSAEVGLGATVTMWKDEGFEGASMRLSADTKYPRLPPTFDERIESLAVACAARQAE
jgi:hypothetical protein